MTFNLDTISNDNICVIWVDDMFDINVWRDAYGERIQTPNIDSILDQGVRFANTYATIPLCSPCRAELATGLSPFRTGLVDLNRIWREVLPPHKGWAYTLRKAGFYNFTTGKVDGKYKPMSEEYRRVLFHDEQEARDQSGKRHKVKKYLPNSGPKIWGANHPHDDGAQDYTFYDHTVAQNAIDFLSSANPNRRHLIQLGFKHPHVPYFCPDRFYDLYDAKKIKWPDCAEPEDFEGEASNTGMYERSYIANGPWIPENVGASKWQEIVRGYFAAISHVDYQIGRFLHALRSSPFGGNTTVIFLSDNGFNLGTHDSFHKMSQWDSAAHVPLGIWSPRMEQAQVIETPVSLHNFPKTIMQLAGITPPTDWVSGQSLLPLIDPSFGDYDKRKSPLTSVFGTLSVRPSLPKYDHLRYLRYPDGEEQVYDMIADPGETRNCIDGAPIDFLRQELCDAALDLGLDLRGAEDPKAGVNAMMAIDGTVALKGTAQDNDFWAYGKDAEKIDPEKGEGTNTLWYMGGPDDYVLKCPASIKNVRIAAVLARYEDTAKSGRKVVEVVAHPDSPIHFETSERVSVDVTGSNQNDILIGPSYGDSTLRGGAGDDFIMAVSERGQMNFYGGEGQDTLIGGLGDDLLDGGTGNDKIIGKSGNNTLRGGYGNDIIRDGAGASEVYTGAGRNQITLGEGDDTIHVGPGYNFIYPGPGAVTFHIQYGGVTIINRWDKTQKYLLENWPHPPALSRLNDTTWDFALGQSILRIKKVKDGNNLLSQIQTVDLGTAD